MRVFLDANILFSAAYREENPALLLFDSAHAGHCSLYASDFAIEEARRNIRAKAAPRSAVLETLLADVIRTDEPGTAALEAASKHGLPTKDVPILAAAIHAKAQLLVTGDLMHFSNLFNKRVEGVLIARLRKALESIVADATRRH